MNRTALGLLSVLVVVLVVVGALTTRALMRGAVQLVEAARTASVRSDDGEPTAPPRDDGEEEPEGDDQDADRDAEDADQVAPLERLAVAGAELAVYHDRPVKEPLALLRRVARGTGIGVFEGDAPDEARPPYVKVRHVPVAEYEVLGQDTVDAGRDMAPADKAALKRSTSVTVLNFVLPVDKGLLQASRLVAAYARLAGNVVWDEDAGEYLSQKAFKTRRLQSWEGERPNVALHFTVFTSTSEDGVTLTTGGLRHFALPELSLGDVPAELEDDAVAAINALVQTMVEQGWDGASQVNVELDALAHAGLRGAMQARASASAVKRVRIGLTPGGEDGPVRVSFPSGDVRAGLKALFGTTVE